MNKKFLAILVVLILTVSGCNAGPFNTNTIVGSGKVASETRTVSGFDYVELKGSGNVEISFGTTESVTVKGDDNILPLIETSVLGDTLVINTKPFTTMTTANEIKISITMKSLQGLTLSGSGNIDVAGVNGKSIVVEMPGSGNITVNGTSDSVTIRLPGSGNIFCEGLKTQSATVTMDGSGNITVFASNLLDASIRGSGSIHYFGNPTQVKTNVTGSGTITP